MTCQLCDHPEARIQPLQVSILGREAPAESVVSATGEALMPPGPAHTAHGQAGPV